MIRIQTYDEFFQTRLRKKWRKKRVFGFDQLEKKPKEGEPINPDLTIPNPKEMGC